MDIKENRVEDQQLEPLKRQFEKAKNLFAQIQASSLLANLGYTQEQKEIAKSVLADLSSSSEIKVYSKPKPWALFGRQKEFQVDILDCGGFCLSADRPKRDIASSFLSEPKTIFFEENEELIAQISTLPIDGSIDFNDPIAVAKALFEGRETTPKGKPIKIVELTTKNTLKHLVKSDKTEAFLAAKWVDDNCLQLLTRANFTNVMTGMFDDEFEDKHVWRRLKTVTDSDGKKFVLFGRKPDNARDETLKK